MGKDRFIFLSNRLWIALGLFALAGIVFVLLSTRYGAFLSDDSYYYIEPARAALQGKGFNPSTFFAPLLPSVLLLMGWLGAEPLTAIRYLHAILFGVNILLTGVIAKQAGISDLFAGFISLLVLLSDVLLQMHGWAMSEAICQTFILTALILFALYLKNPTYLLLVLTAGATGLACLARYAALPAVPALLLGLLVYDASRPFMRRVWRGVVFTATSLLPLLAYLVRNILVSGLATRYESLKSPPISIARLNWYLYNTLSWFVPGRLIRGREIPSGILFAILLTAGMLVYLKIRRTPANEPGEVSPVILVWIAFIVLNLVMLFLAGGLTGLAADNPRYLAPILWALLILVGYFLDRLWKTGSRPLLYATAAFSLVFLVYYGVRAYNYLSGMYRTGLGYSNIGWHTSETVAYLKSHPDIEVVSTGEMGIYFWTGKRPAVITDFGGAGGLIQHLCQTGGDLFIMNQMPAELYHMSQAEIVQGLTLVRKFNDSLMYQCPKP